MCSVLTLGWFLSFFIICVDILCLSKLIYKKFKAVPSLFFTVAKASLLSEITGVQTQPTVTQAKRNTNFV